MKDGAIFADTGLSGFGYVVRDDVGMFVTAGEELKPVSILEKRDMGNGHIT